MTELDSLQARQAPQYKLVSIRDLPDEWFSSPEVRARFTLDSVVELKDQSILNNKRFSIKLRPVNARSSGAIHVRLRIGVPSVSSRLSIEISVKGRGNHISLGDSITGSWIMYLYGRSRVEIGSDSSAIGLKMYVGNRCQCRVGQDCLISDCVLLQCGDGHGLVDLAKRQQINRSMSSIKIGNHCWLGRCAAVVTSSKKVCMGSGSVLGLGAVLARSIPETSLAIGIPARVVRSHITWHYNHLVSRDEIDELCEMFPGSSVEIESFSKIRSHFISKSYFLICSLISSVRGFFR